MRDLSQQILQQVQQQKLKPIPRWRFVLIRVLLVALFLLTLTVGAMAFGLLLESLWPDLTPSMRHRGFSQMALGALPIIWALFVVLLVSVAVFVFQHFRYGYRLRIVTVLAMTVGGSALVGWGAHQMEWTFQIHRTLMHRVPFYAQSFDQHRRTYWQQPEQGRLAGDVFQDSTGVWKLQDFEKRIWDVVDSPTNSLFPVSPGRYRVWGQMCGAAFCAQAMREWYSPNPQKKGQGLGPKNGGGRRGWRKE